MGLECFEPYGAFYVMLIVDKFFGAKCRGQVLKGSMDVADALLTYKKVAATPGVCFGEDSAIRLSYALSMDDMTEGLEKIAEFFKELN